MESFPIYIAIDDISDAQAVGVMNIDQHLKNIQEGDRIRLHIEIHRPRMFSFSVDGAKNVTGRKDYAEDGTRKRYRQTIPVKKTNPSKESSRQSGILHTENSQNNIRLIEFKDEGEVEIWEVAVISRYGKFFLTTQRVYSFFCRREDQSLISERFGPESPNAWPQLMDYMEFSLKERELFAGLPEFCKERLNPPMIPEEENIGVVIWFNVRTGVGMILTKEGESRVYFYDLEITERGPGFLYPGERVSYEEITLPPREDSHSTSIQRQAVGVCLL
ncbi:MAG: hypothetical protein WD552_01190 [Candidatus Paceibacterota bacterium]